MDSFTYIVPTEIPADNEKGGSYCAVAHTTTIDVPTNTESGGSSGIAYCIIA